MRPRWSTDSHLERERFQHVVLLTLTEALAGSFQDRKGCVRSPGSSLCCSTKHSFRILRNRTPTLFSSSPHRHFLSTMRRHPPGEPHVYSEGSVRQVGSEQTTRTLISSLILSIDSSCKKDVHGKRDLLTSIHHPFPCSHSYAIHETLLFAFLPPPA